MNTRLALVQPATEPQPSGENRQDWLSWLQDQLDPAWRSGEWRPEQLLFEGDPANDATPIWKCRVSACRTLLSRNNRRCDSCALDAEASSLSAAEFDTNHQPSRSKWLVGVAGQDRCLVTAGELRCERDAQRSGLCHAHEVALRRHKRKSPGLTLESWIQETGPRPMKHQGFCMVVGCNREQIRDRFCLSHSNRIDSASSSDATDPTLRAHQFWLGGLTPVVRSEVLFALQDRDRSGWRLDPGRVRLAVRKLAHIDTLCGLNIGGIKFGGIRNSTAGRSLMGAMQRTVEYAFQQFTGEDPSLDDVWDAAGMGLWAASHRRYDTLSGTIDFTTIRQKWLREIVKEWGRSTRPNVHDLRVNVKAFTIAADTLAGRSGGGENLPRLNGADMTAIVHAFKQARKEDGELYSEGSRRRFLTGWFNVLDFARSSCLMEGVPGSFTRARYHRIMASETNEEKAGKALPRTVVQQLDASLPLLTGSHQGWAQETSRIFYRTAYAILRDTGRRLGEVVTLKAGCVEFVDGSPQLVYDNHKAGRHGRRLPITHDLADLILIWEKCRAELPLSKSALPWLFPSPMHRARGTGHIRAASLADGLREWVRAIPGIESDVIGPDGTPLLFDRSLITAHAFRHTYAQRHADAGVPVDVLRDLMDHKSVNTTMGYYQVTLKRKREAVKSMAPLAVDRFGKPAPIPEPRYEIGSVAVPFGNCTEPSNVKAGGGSCPIRFQCSGCNFYRPDPSYLPAIEDHIRSLKTDKETADAIGAAPFVVDNLTAQIDSFRDVVSTMRVQLSELDEEERKEIEEASKTLRKARATAAHQLLPVTVVNQRKGDS